MSDLAAARAAARARLADRIGREVIVMNITLLLLIVDAVELLRFADRTERGNGQHLCLTARKHTGTVHARQQADLRGQRADLVHFASVDTLLFIEQPAADNELLKLVDRFINYRCVRLFLVVKLLMDALDNRRQALIAHVLVIGIERGLNIVDCKIPDRVEQLVRDLHRLERELGLADFGLDVLNERDHALDLLVALDDRVEHHIVGNLVRARLDHADYILVSGHSQVQIALCALGSVRADDDLAVDKAHIDAGNRPVPRDVGNRQRERSADHAGDLRQAVGIDRHDGHDDRTVVAHILREQRADRPVDEARGQDRLVGRTRLALDERAGDLADSVKLFLKIDGKREEVDAFARLGRGGHIDEHNRFAPAHQHRSVRQAAHLARLKRHLFPAVFDFINLVVFKHCSTSVYKFSFTEAACLLASISASGARASR